MNTNTLATINGIAKSVTMWVAGILVALGQVVPFITPETLASVGIEHGPTATRILTVAGIIMGLCRFITSKSLATKGGLVAVDVQAAPTAANPAPAPVAQDAILQPPPAAPAPALATVSPTPSSEKTP